MRWCRYVNVLNAEPVLTPHQWQRFIDAMEGTPTMITDPTEPCDDDGLETTGVPRDDEPTDADVSRADFDYQAPGFEPLPEGEDD